MSMGHWQPSMAIKASAAVHVGAAVAWAGGMAWPWSAGALIANHAILTLAGLWPRSTLLGSNMRQLPQAAVKAGQIAITIDDGPHPEITPRVLDILDIYQAKASFFCIGEKVLAHPQIAREILARGHSIENHSNTHRHHFSVMGMGALRREISAAQASIAQTTGYQPRYFRAPAGLRSPLLDPVLQELGLQLTSWTRRGFDTVRNDAAQVLSRLEQGLAAGDILLLHDGNCALTAQGNPVIMEVLPQLLDRVVRSGLKPISLHHLSSNDSN